ncbi:MAG TPA: ABC transporter ATP-binding protein [Stellaceae bacterium]|nr:ABC transporter ATP-binding protein [Stellaceae bacterium]
MTQTVIAARGLSKRYGRTVAVDGIDLEIRAGEIFGLLGPNGAGKTTTILMLLGLTEVSGGEIRVRGFDPAREPLEVKRRVGYLPDSVGFYDNLSARENLRYTGKLAGIERGDVEARIGAALKRVSLDGVADDRVATFSRGMRQRLGLAEIAMKRSEVAILDEPTSGLDPQATFELLDMIRDLKADGVAVLISSHLLDRVQAVCDRVALFHQGKIVLIGTVPELAERVLGGGHTFDVEVGDNGNMEPLVASIAGVRSVRAEGAGRYHVVASRDVGSDLATIIMSAGASLRRLERIEPGLDVIYRRYFEAPHGTA